MFGDRKEYWLTQRDGDRAQNGPEDDPDKIQADRIEEDLRIIGIENGEEVSRDREKWRDVVAAAMDLNGL